MFTSTTSHRYYKLIDNAHDFGLYKYTTTLKIMKNKYRRNTILQRLDYYLVN